MCLGSGRDPRMSESENLIFGSPKNIKLILYNIKFILFGDYKFSLKIRTRISGHSPTPTEWTLLSIRFVARSNCLQYQLLLDASGRNNNFFTPSAADAIVYNDRARDGYLYIQLRVSLKHGRRRSSRSVNHDKTPCLVSCK